MLHVSITAQRIAAACTLACAALAAHAAPLSSSFDVTGAVARPATYDRAALEALPAVTQTVTFSAAGVPQTHTYTGASLWGMLDGAGIVDDPTRKNAVLDKFVLATATDGYKVVLSLGELNPSFGNRPDAVAYDDENGPLGSDGFARIVTPGDAKGGRYLSNLTNLQVQESASKQTRTDGLPSTSFVVSGDVAGDKIFDLAALKALPTVTRTVGAVTYAGVSLWDLLVSSVGIPLDPAVKNDQLGKYVVATGSDGYQVVFSLGELDPSFGGMPDFIAYEANGVGLGASGFARIVAPDDVRMGRWVSNLISLEVFSANAVPEPAPWLLLPTGLLLMTTLRRRGAMRCAPRWPA